MNLFGDWVINDRYWQCKYNLPNMILIKSYLNEEVIYLTFKNKLALEISKIFSSKHTFKFIEFYYENMFCFENINYKSNCFDEIKQEIDIAIYKYENLKAFL